MEAKKVALGVTGPAVLASAAVLYCSATITDGFLQLAAVAALFAGVALTIVVLACRRKHRTGRLALPALILAGTAWLTTTDLPEETMLDLVTDDLQRIAGSGEPGRAGPYRILDPIQKGTAVLLPVSGTGWIFSHSGFVYAPDGSSTIPPLGEDFESLDFWHLEGPWYGYYLVET